MKTAAQLSSKEIESYRKSFRKRQHDQTRQLEVRKQRAWDLTRQAGALLKEKFGASRVVVFGSLAREQMFTKWSDVDLAAWGLQAKDTFRAIGALYDLDQEIRINLVDVNTASASLLETIKKDGIEI